MTSIIIAIEADVASRIMASSESSATRTSTRPTLSCNRCAERKVKCDRQRPRCGACSKHNVDCNFNASKPTQKKQKRIKVQVLCDQLKRYEKLLQKNGIISPDSLGDALPERSGPQEPMQEDSHQVVSYFSGQGEVRSRNASPLHGENLKFVEK